MLKIDGDRPFATVESVEESGEAIRCNAQTPIPLTPGTLNLDHLGAHVCEQSSRIRSLKKAREVKHSQARHGTVRALTHGPPPEY